MTSGDTRHDELRADLTPSGDRRGSRRAGGRSQDLGGRDEGRGLQGPSCDARPVRILASGTTSARRPPRSRWRRAIKPWQPFRAELDQTPDHGRHEVVGTAPRRQYRPAAHHGAILYVVDLSARQFMSADLRIDPSLRLGDRGVPPLRVRVIVDAVMRIPAPLAPSADPAASAGAETFEAP
jgi:hypothetical protein